MDENKLSTGQEIYLEPEETITNVEVISKAIMENDAISPMCYGGETGSGCDDSNTMQTAIYLPISVWMNGCICCPGTEIWYRFTANISDATEYTIYTSGTLDTVGSLYNSSGTLIASNDDGGVNSNFSITQQLIYGATYYVKVKAFGSHTGEYNVRVSYTTQTSGGCDFDFDCSNDLTTAIPLSLNSWQMGEICCSGADMWYKFTPSTTAYYTIYTGGSLDTVGCLYDSNNNQINSNDDSDSGLNFKIVHQLTANQTYYIKVNAYGNSTGYFTIIVINDVYVESVTINDSYVTLKKGDSVTLSATVLPPYATDKTLRWESSDIGVAIVDSLTGEVTAVGRGTACISAYSQDGSGKSSCCEVLVNVPVETITINTSSLLMRVGEYAYLYAEICPSDAVNQSVRWTSSDTSVVWVNEATGRVEARGIGNATVYATAQDGTGVRGSCAVRVEAPIAVQGIDICCETATMNVGETTYLSYEIYPSDATNKSVTWCSSNPNVASVDAITGYIQALGVGNTVIQVSDNDGHTSECNIEVKSLVKRFETEKTIFGAVINDVIGAQAYSVSLNMTYHITKIESGKAYVSEIWAFTKYDKGNTAFGLEYPDVSIGRLQIGSDTYTMESDNREMLVSPSWKWDAKIIHLNKWYDIGTMISLLSIVMLDASLFPYRDVELETSLTIS